MKNLLNPKWLFVINTCPIVILFLISYGDFMIIRSLLSPETIFIWEKFSLALASIAVFNFCYALFLIIKKKDVSPWFGLLALMAYLSFLYQYALNAQNIIPENIPGWMISGDPLLHTGTFLMPTLAYSLLIMVVHMTPQHENKKAWKNFLSAISVPAVWYLFFEFVLPLSKIPDTGFSLHAVIVSLITGTVIFFFFLARAVYILSLGGDFQWNEFNSFWKILISLILPLIGLFVNNHPIFGIDNAHSGVFGDFHNPWFYILALLNGIMLCIPNPDKKTARLILFMLRCLTFAYTLYFFFVFLPYLPFSIPAILCLGTGFLMLTPTVLFVLHVGELSRDYNFLGRYFSNKLITTASICSFLIIPATITLGYWHDKEILNETLDYLYQPDYSRNYQIEKTSLSNTMEVIKQHKTRNANLLPSNQIPYLSSYFNWLVLDNLTLSDVKINKIENVFFGESSFQLTQPASRNDSVVISKINSSSRFDSTQKVWKSRIDLAITNNSTSENLTSYSTTFRLTEGCWISDYYLFIGNKKESGILAEKKAAMWVFSQILNDKKDPGILYYQTANTIALRVFPFSKNEIRKTGFELLHKEPVTINLDGYTIALGDFNDTKPITEIESKNVRYVSAKQKTELEQVRRKPYYHFMVDISEGKENVRTKYEKSIQNLLDKKLISADNAKISFVNSFVTTISFTDNFSENLGKQIFEGGFYIDHAIKKTLFNVYKSADPVYPVIVVVSDRDKNKFTKNDYTDFKLCYPESNFYYILNTDGSLTSQSFSIADSLLHDTGQSFTNRKVLAFPDAKNPKAYLPDDGQAGLVLKQSSFEIDEKEILEKNWLSGLEMQGAWISQTLHPETSGNRWIKLVKSSFISKIMSPANAYLVVENQAQKAILNRKQAQILSSNKSLDPGEDTQRMSEPDLTVMIFMISLLGWITRRKIIL